ncbi:MAG: S1C family serine protease [Planctomycetota bacterium]
MQHHIRLLAIALIIFAITLPAGIATADDGDRIEQALEQARIAAGKRIAPSVVMIDVDRSADEDAPSEGFFRNPGENPEYRKRPDGAVSGVVISRDGYILTSNFNVSGTIRKLTVTLADGRQLVGKVLGRHEVNDIALIKVDATDLPVPDIRNTHDNALEVGRFCAVVGRAMTPTEHTMTCGIISALERDRKGAIQFDAQANFGNTGGPLIDLRGRLIGIVYSIRPGVTHGINSGVCYAMPIHLVLNDLDALKSGRVIVKPRTPFFGIKPDSDVQGVRGVRIAQVIPGSGADGGGLQDGDVIIQVDDKVLTTVTDLRAFLRDMKIGDRVRVKYTRGGREYQTTVILGEQS